MLTTNCNIEEFENVSGIYYIINLETKRKYIGSSTNLYSRWKSHSYYTSNFELRKEIKEKGQKGFIFKIVDYFENISIEDLMKIEDSYLELYYSLEYIESKGKDKRFRELLYNCMPKSGGVFHREYTEEKRKQIGEDRKGKFCGKPYLKETKEKMLDTMQKKGQSKKVYCLNLNSKEISEYHSIREAERCTGAFRCNIIKVLNKKANYANGFYFSLHPITNIEEVISIARNTFVEVNKKKCKQYNVLNIEDNSSHILVSLKEVALFCNCAVSSIWKQTSKGRLLKEKYKIFGHDS